MSWAGHVARMGERRCVYRGLVRKPEGKSPLGRPRRRWEDIKMDLQEVGRGAVDWIELAQDRDRRGALVNDMIYLLTAIGLSPGGSSTVHIYTQTINRTTQITTEQHK